jgi:PAS domain S-box-containing protein
MSVTFPAQLDWLRSAADTGRVGFWHLDLATGTIECTSVCKANLGVAPDAKLTLTTIWDVMHPDDREHVNTEVRHAVDTRGDYAVEYRAIWPDGSVHYILSRGRYADADGRPAVVGTTIDDTERHRAEELNRLITTHVAEGICFIDASGRLTMMNPAAEKILGWTESELRGRPIHAAVHHTLPDGSPFPVEQCAMMRTISDGAPVINHDDVVIHKDGHMVPVRCSAIPIVRNGHVTGAVYSLHDTTSQREIDEALREASRAKDEFLATVSHELRTPMTSILGWVGLMKMMPLDSELRMAVEQIELSAKAQAAIVDDLIDVSRAVTGKLRLTLDNVDVMTIIDETLGTVAPAAAAKRISLTKSITCDDCIVRGDRGRLHQVLWNLLSNAIKFTPAGGTVAVHVEAVGDHLAVHVSDSGIGIIPEFLPRVFDRFSQQSASASRQHGGLGLGLAIVKQLVEMHGGEARAESAGIGTGATFTFTLPRPASR